MRVLMFGWEFPPHIAGGLGTACYGMTRGLARNGVDVTFVVPHAYGDEDQRFIHVVNASDVEALYGSASLYSSTAPTLTLPRALILPFISCKVRCAFGISSGTTPTSSASRRES